MFASLRTGQALCDFAGDYFREAMRSLHSMRVVFEDKWTWRQAKYFTWTFHAIAEFMRSISLEQGELILNFSDEGISPCLAYSDYRPGFFLIPDFWFLLLAGYRNISTITSLIGADGRTRPGSVLARRHHGISAGPEGGLAVPAASAVMQNLPGTAQSI